ncbi:hypothetical protein UA08_00613 [Talaromyces atroroseus]|uniref:Uncharacterized protein n=1 Tax=Talaromyces atroroseus TaxID=1441469 RepID=A0A225AWC2_TALAT|nr:hypothetical protein UA08_00613 [Talaromyces atroroseus]OKL63913.1 hypothetical protein UA08_00613 [Talaromyces atroroseus]
MGIVSKLASSTIGFTSEAIHAARNSSSKRRSVSSSSPSLAGTEHIVVVDGKSGQTQSKDAETGYEDGSPSEELERGVDQDEAAWELDEAARNARLPTYEEAEYMQLGTEDTEAEKVRKKEAMVRALVRKAGPVSVVQQIPCPVIIPQRRPRFKDRGFVRAYAPVLADSGISQDVFLEFLEVFDKASEADAWLDVIYVASGIVSFAPELIASITGSIIQTVAGTARELQTRRRRNNFLDRVNQELFMPRGLFAMVMAFKDEIPPEKNGVRKITTAFGQIMLIMPEKLDIANDRLGIDDAVAKYSNPDPEMSKAKKRYQDYRLTSGETHGQMQLPDAAPLVYPDLDRIAAQAGEGKAQGAKKAGDWVADYMDRRMQALFEAKHPGSALAVPASERKAFVSRYNDPNHAANSGSLTAVLTGGKVGHHSLADRFVQVSDAIKKSRNGGELPDPERVRGARRARMKEKKSAFLKRTFVQDVLYLLIVNLPGEDQVQQSVAELEQVLRQAKQEPPPGELSSESA